MSAPEVSVVIPTRNRWPLVSRRLAGVLGQEDVALEVVVVDDASSDGTSERLAELDDPRLRVLRHDPPDGRRARAQPRAAAAAGRVGGVPGRRRPLGAAQAARAARRRRAAGAAFAYSAAVVLDDEHERPAWTRRRRPRGSRRS